MEIKVLGRVAGNHGFRAAWIGTTSIIEGYLEPWIKQLLPMPVEQACGNNISRNSRILIWASSVPETRLLERRVKRWTSLLTRYKVLVTLMRCRVTSAHSPGSLKKITLRELLNELCGGVCLLSSFPAKTCGGKNEYTYRLGFTQG